MAFPSRMNKQIRFGLACQESDAVDIIVTLQMRFNRVYLIVQY
jgi:hypothetical protein